MKAPKPKRSTSRIKNSTSEAAGKRGADKLRDAADKVIGRDSMDIAEALSANGKKGKIQSIKLLCDLSKGRSESEEQDDAARVRSMATELASSSQWTGPLPSENHVETTQED